MRSWPMTDWDHDDHEKGAYHEAGHAAVLWTFGVPPTGARDARRLHRHRTRRCHTPVPVHQIATWLAGRRKVNGGS